jgi:2-polyprenyl-3-methyl-5-hydroxy-6-metoxy-1,4-benzoquinol methylase
MINAGTQEFIKQYGEWTAMAIKLPDGSYTLPPAVDHRLKRLVQSAQDFLSKPLAECRVLDLACLEGHYAIEFAMHGAEVLGIEGRQVSLDKCNYVKNMLALTRASFIKEDVRNLSANKHGRFDIVICSGILYHLTAQDAAKLVKAISEVCTGILLLDTFISLSGRSSLEIDEGLVRGHYYSEHGDDEDEEAKSKRLWASIENNVSFWFTEPTLVNLLMDAGFTSVVDILAPTMPDHSRDRKTYLASRGRRIHIFTSDLTNDEPNNHIPEGANPRLDPSQRPRGPIFNVAKRTLPRPVKDVIKPLLRAMKVLPPDTTPPFMKKGRTQKRRPY